MQVSRSQNTIRKINLPVCIPGVPAAGSTGTRKGGHVQDSDKAAWAYMIEHDGKQLADSAGRLGVTNNEMEMTAFLESLKKLEQLGLTQAAFAVCLELPVRYQVG